LALSGTAGGPAASAERISRTADLGPSAIEAWSIWPGGTSGVVGSPASLRFLERFLTDDPIRVRLGKEEVSPFAVTVE
jgi:hypothetical protein